MSVLNLALFFSRGISLQVWDGIGMLDREVALYKRLQEYGVTVCFVTYGDARDFFYTDRLSGIQILCNQWNLSVEFYARWLPWLHWRVLRRADLYKTNQTDGAEAALAAARRWRKPLIARCGYMWSYNVIREQGTQSAAARHALATEYLVFNAAQRIVVTTASMAANVVERIPDVAPRVHVIPNYVDVEAFQPSMTDIIDYDVAFVGRLAPEKNLPALLQAVQQLGIKALIIGDGPEKTSLLQRFSRLSDQIVWVDRVTNSDLPCYLNRAKLFVLPSHYEGHPKALIEAMACGLPVIGADAPGIREVIRHDETGYLCCGTPEGIAAAIRKLLDEDALRSRLGRNARHYAVENFGLGHIVQKELALLREVTLAPS